LRERKRESAGSIRNFLANLLILSFDWMRKLFADPKAWALIQYLPIGATPQVRTNQPASV
jgi:hypothetical protein